MTLVRRYFLTPAFSIAANFRVGTHSVASAILDCYYPQVNRDRLWWHDCPHEFNTPSLRPVLLVRDPVARFASTLGLFGLVTRVDEVLNCLEHSTRLGDFSDPPRWHLGESVSGNWHFAHQYLYLPALCFIFPDQIVEFVRLVDLPILPHIHASPSKPILNQGQIDRINQYYAEDRRLFDSLSDREEHGAWR